MNVSIQIVNVVPALCSSNLNPQKRGSNCIGAPINDFGSKYSIWHCLKHIYHYYMTHTTCIEFLCLLTNLERRKIILKYLQNSQFCTLNVIFEAVRCMCTSHTIPTQTSSPLTLQTSTNVCRRLRTDNTIQWHFNVSTQIVNVAPSLCFSNVKLQKRAAGCTGASINDLWTIYFIWLWFHIATTTTRHTQRVLSSYVFRQT